MERYVEELYINEPRASLTNDPEVVTEDDRGEDVNHVVASQEEQHANLAHHS